jgi:hypothetical protein
MEPMGVQRGEGTPCEVLSFRVRPDFDYTVRAGGDHFSSFRGMVLGPGDHFIVNPRGRVRLQDGGLIPVTNTDEKKQSVNERSGWNKAIARGESEYSRQEGPKPRLHRFRLRRRR